MQMSYLTNLECSFCGTTHEADRIQTVCLKCGKPLFARYDLETLKDVLVRRYLICREASMWRYWELLPIKERSNLVSLGEGWTPLLHTSRLGEEIGIPNLIIKEKTQHSTLS